MLNNNILLLKRDKIFELANRYGAHNIRIFGSTAHGTSKINSDIDFLVEFEDGRSLFDQVGLYQELEELLNCKVDIVEPQGLHWYIKDKILNEAIPL